jgi:hypothetical protein
MVAKPVVVPPPEALGIRLDDAPAAVVVPAPEELGIRLE